jgi:hypothetical protein
MQDRHAPHRLSDRNGLVAAIMTFLVQEYDVNILSAEHQDPSSTSSSCAWSASTDVRRGVLWHLDHCIPSCANKTVTSA